jgi:hypothetical protein
MKSTQVARSWLVVLTSILMFSTACNEAPRTTQEADRFELKQDARGRIVRLDRVTGEITEVTGAQLAPGKRHQNPIGSAATRQPTDRSDGVDPPATANVPEASLCNQEVHSGPKTVTVSTAKAPLFIEPRVLPTPLTDLPRGAEAPVVQVEGDWYLVRFEDRRWGSRVGYVHCAQVRLGTSSHDPVVSTSSSDRVPSVPLQNAPVPDVQPPSTPAAPPASARSPDARPPTEAVAERASYPKRGAGTRVSVVALNRQFSETEYGFVVPGTIRTNAASNANCSAYTNGSLLAHAVGRTVFGMIDSSTNANCSASKTSNTTITPAQTVRYSVRGATFSLQLPDRRVAVVNCDSKVNWTEFSMNARRSCRIPTVDRFDVEFKGDRAKLIWRVGVNAEKAVSETYDLIQILDPPAP